MAFSDSAPAQGHGDTALGQDEPEALILHWPHLAGGSALEGNWVDLRKAGNRLTKKNPKCTWWRRPHAAVGAERPHGSPERPACPGCSPQEGAEFAASQCLLFMETSARLNHQVTAAFDAVGE